MDLVPLKPVRAPGLPAPPIRARYKASPEDFVVDEIPAYRPSGAGEHVFVRIEKVGISTPVAIERICTALDLNPRRVGYAGLKDAQAVARQWLSFEGVEPATLEALTLTSIRVLETGPHDNKLRIGHLVGNRFEVVLRAEAADGFTADELAAVDANLAWLGSHGVANWVGEQRFGRNGRNLEKGLKLLAGRGGGYARAMDKRMQRLMLAAVQSEVFNHVLAERVDDYDRFEAGDVAWLHRNGACFVVEDVDEANRRAADFELSPTGPLPGPKMLRAEGDQGALEADVMEALGLDARDFGSVRGAAVPGARRPLRVALTDAVSEPVSGGLRLTFALDKGAFATAVLRELVADPPWFEAPAGEAGDASDAAG